jgi:hypothetical protein
MAGSIPWRAAAAAVTLALVLSGCGSGGDKDTPASTPSAGGDSAIGGAPATSAPPASAGATSAGGGNGGSNSAPSYPKDAKAYVQELVKAMAKPDYPRISQLAVQSAVQQVRDSITTGGNIDTQWPYIQCTANTGPGQTTCVARNSHGDELTVKLNQLQLGFPTAVTETPLERTTYPKTPDQYVDTLLTAYEHGNQQRMLRLSGDAVVSKIKCSFGRQTTVSMIDATYSKVTVSGLGVDLGKSYEFKVLTASGGKANAVKEATKAQC